MVELLLVGSEAAQAETEDRTQWRRATCASRCSLYLGRAKASERSIVPTSLSHSEVLQFLSARLRPVSLLQTFSVLGVSCLDSVDHGNEKLAARSLLHTR